MRPLVPISSCLAACVSTAAAQGMWIQAAPLTVPAARQGHGMTFDPASQRVVMFGGSLASGTTNDLWQWTGSDWSTLAASGTPPPVRSMCGFCRDPAGGLLVFGGYNPGFGGIISPPNVRNDTWRLQRGVWTQLFLDTIASATSFGAGCVAPNALVPSLLPAPGELPRLGTTMHFRVGNLPAAFTVPVLALGLSNTVANGPPVYALPFDLGFLGWPGCSQLVSPESLTAAAAFGTSIDFPFVVPLNAMFTGFTFHAQAFVLYQSNAAAVSNGITAVVGI